VHFVDAVPKNPVSVFFLLLFLFWGTLSSGVVWCLAASASANEIQSGKIMRKLLREKAALEDTKAKL
jgi:hypothetical protein